MNVNDGINPVSNSSRSRISAPLLHLTILRYPPQLVWIMSALDAIGKIAAAQIAFYTPIAAITLFLIFRYAFRRDGGWFWLFIFSAGNSSLSTYFTLSDLNEIF